MKQQKDVPCGTAGLMRQRADMVLKTPKRLHRFVHVTAQWGFRDGAVKYRQRQYKTFDILGSCSDYRRYAICRMVVADIAGRWRMHDEEVRSLKAG